MRFNYFGSNFATVDFKHKNEVEDIVTSQSSELEELQVQYNELLQNNNVLQNDIEYLKNWRAGGSNGVIFNDMQISLAGKSITNYTFTNDDYVKLRFADTSSEKFLFPIFSIGGTVIDTYKINDDGQVMTSVFCYGSINSQFYFIKCVEFDLPIVVHVSPYLNEYNYETPSGEKYYFIDIFGVPFNNSTSILFTDVISTFALLHFGL